MHLLPFLLSGHDGDGGFSSRIGYSILWDTAPDSDWEGDSPGIRAGVDPVGTREFSLVEIQNQFSWSYCNDRAIANQ
jgi:hypothetical protein